MANEHDDTSRLASKAFRRVLGRKQSGYHGVLAWLDGAIVNAMPGNARAVLKLQRIAQQGDQVFAGYRY